MNRRKKCPRCGKSRGQQRPGEGGPYPRILCEPCKEHERYENTYGASRNVIG